MRTQETKRRRGEVWVDCVVARDAYAKVQYTSGLRERIQKYRLSAGQIARILGKDYKKSAVLESVTPVHEANAKKFADACSIKYEDIMLTDSEAAARLPAPIDSNIPDFPIILFFRMCFDRPAFKTLFMKEVSEEDFDKAIEDTVTAINTGKLIHRQDRTVLAEGAPRHKLQSREYRQRMEEVESLLQLVRATYRTSVRDNRTKIFESGDTFIMSHTDSTAGTEIDRLRQATLKLLNVMFESAGIDPITFSDYR